MKINNSLKSQNQQNHLNVVLCQPEIPYNTGNVARSCVAFNATLHLIRPYGFFLNDKRMLRASTDYWQNLTLIEHDSLNLFLAAIKPNDKLYFFTKTGTNNLADLDFNLDSQKEIYLIFGQETNGLPKDLIKKYAQQTVRIPLSVTSRCLNLSNSVVCGLYEVMRQNKFNGLEIKYAPSK